MVITHQGEMATVYTIADPVGRDKSGTYGEEIPCYDPLRMIEAELARYRLVTPASVLQDELPRFHGGAVGYLSYETASRFEHLPVPEKNELGLPLAVFCFTETVLVFDHVKHRARIVTHLHLDAPDLVIEYQRCRAILEAIQSRLQQPVRLPDEPVCISDATALQVTSNRTQSEFEEMVRRGVAYIRAGDVFQVVPSQRLSRHVNAAPFTIYRALRTINPSPYMFYLDMHDFYIVGASPELLVRVEDGDGSVYREADIAMGEGYREGTVGQRMDAINRILTVDPDLSRGERSEGKEVTIRPIAGTRPRGVDRQNDEHFAKELKNDPKEQAEHVMLVDLARNDIGRVSTPGSIHVTEFMEIERYSHVMHLVSNITGQLHGDATPFDALRAGFPAGTVSGAPKIRAMEIISELEGEQRGVYAGAVGYFSHSGNQETAIALRTMVIKNGRAYIQAGCGVVADSDPTAEYKESLNKARALLRALDEAENIANERSHQVDYTRCDAAHRTRG